jgi:cullin 1
LACLVQFQTTILSAGSWPLQPSTLAVNLPNEVRNYCFCQLFIGLAHSLSFSPQLTSCNLVPIPIQLQKCIRLFYDFYQTQHSGRKLDWLFSLSKGEIQATFAKKLSYTFQVSTFQMIVLIQYNDADVLTFEELMTRTRLDQGILTQTLDTFLKFGILLIENPQMNFSTPSNVAANPFASDFSTEKFPPQTQFSLNCNYHSKRLKVNLNVPLRLEQRTDREEAQKTVEEDRKLLIQASIVRIMKSRRLLKHVALVNEVIEQLQSRFQPKVSDIKQSIDLLIEKEYLHRVEEQRDVLSYNA